MLARDPTADSVREEIEKRLRKIASLERLVVNGSLMQQGYFFWDEPEANLNPKLTAVVAEVLRELAANGVQVFVTTHDYLLTKQLDLLSAMTPNPPTRFFLFRRPTRASPVEVTHADRLSDLSDNPIAEEFVRLYELKRTSKRTPQNDGNRRRRAAVRARRHLDAAKMGRSPRIAMVSMATEARRPSTSSHCATGTSSG